MVLNLAVREELARLINDEEKDQIQAWELITTAATKAAGQVRDKRIDDLENPRTPEQDLLFDLMVSLALDTSVGVAGKYLKVAAKRVIASRYGKSLKLRPAIDQDARTGFLMTGAFEDFDRAEQAAEAAIKNGELFEKVFTGLSLFAVGEIKSRAEKRNKPGLASPIGQALPAAADSPSSAVQGAVQRHAAIQKAAIGKVMHGYQVALTDPTTTPEFAEALRRFLEGKDSKAPVATVDDETRLKLFFETCIWCLYLPRISSTEVEPAVIDVNVDTLPLGAPAPIVTNRFAVDGKRAAYLVNRLPHPEGDGILTFAQFDYKNHPFDPTKLTEYERGLVTNRWQDKDGETLESLLVPNEAYSALALHFVQMTGATAKIQERLDKLKPQVFVFEPQQPQPDPRNGFRALQNPRPSK